MIPNPWVVPAVTISEAGELLGVAPATAYRYVRAGDLPTVTVAGRLTVRTVDLYGLLGLPIPARPQPPRPGMKLP